ncbi:hypothetical protein [Pseudodesulfovibrio karagichevae]|uniref:4Fe-4S ferredoxin-type domain-containing protein n=1 Tax=Pseudodesulfovibrio karagichevae TaxID=3239305 RepID=A0ABV4K587_9BACT
MFGWNNDAYGGQGSGRGNRSHGRGRRTSAGFGFGGGQGNGRGFGQGLCRDFDDGQGFGNGFGPGCGQNRERFDDFGQGRMGRGPCGMGLNRFRPGRGGAFRAAMNAEADGFGPSLGPDAGFCPLCEKHCPLSAPSCPKGEGYAARVR